MSRLAFVDQRFPLVSEILAKPAAQQLLRYAIAGFCVTQLAAAIYSVVVYFAHLAPLVANTISTGFGLGAGYLAHSRWSFSVPGSENDSLQLGRFLFASFLAFLVNSFWIWLLVHQLDLSPLAPVPMMMLATPFASFLLNRYWVFRAF